MTPIAHNEIPNAEQSAAFGQATGSARMTLMRGSPEEIERDLAAIDAKANRQLIEIERLRGALSAIAHEWQTQSEACADNSAVGHRMAEIARDALLPNAASETRGPLAPNAESGTEPRCL